MFYTYALTFNSEIGYIGCTNDLGMRLRTHRYRAKSCATPLYDWMRSVGPKNVEIVATLAFYSRDEAKTAETRQIKALRDRGYHPTNLRDADNGYKPTLETRAKMSAAHFRRSTRRKAAP